MAPVSLTEAKIYAFLVLFQELPPPFLGDTCYHDAVSAASDCDRNRPAAKIHGQLRISHHFDPAMLN